MLKRYFAFFSAVFLIIGLAPLKAVAATAADYDAVYKYNLAVYDSKHTDKATLAYYILSEYYVQSDNADIIARARSITSGSTSDYSKIKAVHDWVANNMWYDTTNSGEYSATDMLTSKHGACYGYANLTTALLRAVGIPAKTVKGYAKGSGSGFLDVSNSNTAPDHAWSEAYADGRWIIMDVTWDSQNKYVNGVPSTKKACKADYFDISLKELSKDHRYMEYIDYRSKDGMIFDIKTNELIGINRAYYDTLTDLIIPDGVTGIRRGASFSQCSNLTSVVIPDSLTFIGGSAFHSVPKLYKIIIPESVTEIEDGAFDLERSPFIVLYGNAGSYAEKYAKSHSIPFLLLTQLPTAADRKPSTWAAEQVNAAIKTGLVPDAMQFKYMRSVSRAEFCALAVTLYEKYTGDTIHKRIPFEDTNNIFAKKMAAVEVVTGVGKNKFAPDEELTREAAAVLLTNLAKAIGKPLPNASAVFVDSESISPWALAQVGQIQNAGIMGGIAGNKFDPKSPYTLEQSIITMLRLWNAVHT